MRPSSSGGMGMNDRLGLDWTRTKARTRSAMAQSKAGSRISSQGMAAAPLMPEAISMRRSASWLRMANQIAWVSGLAVRTCRYSSSPRLHSMASICAIWTGSTAPGFWR